MTIEEKAEAYKQSLHPYVSCSERQAECGKIGYIKGYMDCLEENKELKERCDRKSKALVKLLEENEKLKCCQNCKHWEESCEYKKCKYRYLPVYRDEMNDNHWELAE